MVVSIFKLIDYKINLFIDEMILLWICMYIRNILNILIQCYCSIDCGVDPFIFW